MASRTSVIVAQPSAFAQLHDRIVDRGYASIDEQHLLYRECAGTDARIVHLMEWLVEDIGMSIVCVIQQIKALPGGQPRREALEYARRSHSSAKLRRS